MSEAGLIEICYVSGIVLLTSNLWFLFRVLRPVKRLSLQAEHIRKGDFESLEQDCGGIAEIGAQIVIGPDPHDLGMRFCRIEGLHVPGDRVDMQERPIDEIGFDVSLHRRLQSDRLGCWNLGLCLAGRDTNRHCQERERNARDRSLPRPKRPPTRSPRIAGEYSDAHAIPLTDWPKHSGWLLGS